MEIRDIFESYRKSLKELLKQGHSTLKIRDLINHSKVLEENVINHEKYNDKKHENHLAQYAANNQTSDEMLKAVLEAGKSALHYIIIVNGGAVITIMGVLSNLVKENSNKLLVHGLSYALLFFGLGVLAGTFGFGMRYLSQDFYSGNFNDQKKWKLYIGNSFKTLSILSAIAGLLLFAFGVYSAFIQFQTLYGAKFVTDPFFMKNWL